MSCQAVTGGAPQLSSAEIESPARFQSAGFSPRLLHCSAVLLCLQAVLHKLDTDTSSQILPPPPNILASHCCQACIPANVTKQPAGTFRKAGGSITTDLPCASVQKHWYMMLCAVQARDTIVSVQTGCPLGAAAAVWGCDCRCSNRGQTKQSCGTSANQTAGTTRG